MEEGGAGSLDVVMLPWLAFGHMIPFLELSKRLATRGHTVTFLSTPRNLARLPPVPANLSAHLRFQPLPMPTVDGLPDDAESTADVPPDKAELVKVACDGLAAPFAAFLDDAVAAAGRRKPDWIIVDFCYHWLPPIADEHEVPCAIFNSMPAAMFALFGPRWANTQYPRTAAEDFTVPPKWIPFPSTIAFRRLEATWIAGRFQRNESGVADLERFWQTEERCRLIINRSCHEVELPGMFDFLADLFRKPTVPAGLLLPCNHAAIDDDGGAGGRSEVLQWLDGQTPKSVIYVALGSEAPLTVETIHELALGLELAGVRFIWALRNRAGAVDVATALPGGFEQRTRGHGVVWTGWVPQVEVLAHDAVGAFLTHCGWGSTVESLASGHPLVMLPFVLDQGVIARAMAERGVGVEVARGEDDNGSFDRDGVAAAVRRVMAGESEREAFVRNAEKLKEVAGDRGRQEQYVDDLVGYLRRYKLTRMNSQTS